MRQFASISYLGRPRKQMRIFALLNFTTAAAWVKTGLYFDISGFYYYYYYFLN